MHYDVITVGGGPSGAYVSYLLAKEGLKVLLLDKGKPAHKLCTGVISEEAFQAFPLSRRCILREISSIEFVAPDGEGFTYEHPAPFAHAVDRTAFDSMLIDMAQRAGVNFLGEAMVNSLEVTKDKAKVHYEKNGQFVAEAWSLVLAAGLNQRLLNMVGLRPPDNLNGIQLEVGYHEQEQVKVFLGNKIAPGSFAWVVPLGAGKARIGLSTHERVTPYFDQFLKSLGIKGEIDTVRPRPIPYGMAPQTYAHRTLVVGDAAGQVKTTTGGGIYYGILGAEIAAQVLKEAFSKSDFSEENLRTYEERWKAKLAPEIEMGLKLREIFSTIGDERITSLINLARNDGIATLLQLQAKFDWHRRFFMFLLRRTDVRNLLGRSMGIINEFF